MGRQATAVSAAGSSAEERRAVQPASRGRGPLLQRDYVAVVMDSACTPEQAMERLRRDFRRFSPEELARFSRPAGATHPLASGDTMHVHIAGAGECGVRVCQVDARSLTLRTLEGHPEAGRITFGASHDEAGRLVLRIRSRARIHDLVRYIGYRLVGRHAQSRVWILFLERLAAACGGRVLGRVLLSTDEVRDSPADRDEEETPTFGARSEADQGEL